MIQYMDTDHILVHCKDRMKLRDNRKRATGHEQVSKILSVVRVITCLHPHSRTLDFVNRICRCHKPALCNTPSIEVV